MRLLGALLFSVLLHATVAGLFSRQKSVAVVATPKATHATRVSLFQRAAEKPASARVDGPPRHARALGRPAVAILPAVEEGPVAPAEAEVAAEVEAPASAAETTTVAAAAAPALLARVIDTAALHARLAESAQRCYPAAARRFGLAGEAQLDFCLDKTGALASHTLSHSSGQSLLDSAATDCVLQGAQPFPVETAGGCFSLPVRFGR